jgi:hypothetical protein
VKIIEEKSKMKYKKINFSLICVLISFLTVSCLNLQEGQTQKHNYKPEQGYVSDEETAIQIAVAVWIPIYGKGEIESQKPYNAVLMDEIWYVTGSLPEGWLGGVAEAEIAKDDGRILRMSHDE